jgi:hypothetical protein
MYRTGDIAWRLQIGSAFIPSIPLFFIYYCPGTKMTRVFPHLLTNHRVTTLSDSETFVSLARIKTAAQQPFQDILKANVETVEYRRAYESLVLLRNTPLQASRDLILISTQVRDEEAFFQASGVTGKSS